MVRLWWVGLACLVGCGGGGGGSSGDAGPQHDGALSADGGSADGGSADGGSVDAGGPVDGSAGDGATPDAAAGCGMGVTFTNPSVRMLPLQNSPGAGINVTASTCAGASLGTTDVDGRFPLARVAHDVPFYVKSSGGARLTGLSAEYQLPSGSSAGGSGLGVIFDQARLADYPDHDASHGEVEVHLTAGLAGGACAGVATDYVVTVAAHPEAHIIYWDGAGPNATLTATMTGVVYIGRLDPGTPVIVSATKPGSACTANFSAAGATGRAPVEAGAITYLAGIPQ